MSAPTGGTITYNGNKTVHTFTTSGDFIIPSGQSGNIEVLIVAGGGGGGRSDGASGAGGGGGVIHKISDSIVAGTYSVVVGAGGAKITSGTSQGNNGEDSTFHGLIAKGGGGGAGGTGSAQAGKNGGSGGGGCYGSGAGGTEIQTTQSGDSGTYGHGYDGGIGGPQSGAHGTGGGGGASQAGANGSDTVGGDGGDGYACSISGTSTYYGGGGGGGVQTSSYTGGTGGLGGGGNGDYADGNAGTPNTGGGGSGGGPNGNGYSGAQGGSGIVIISYVTEDFLTVGVAGTLTFADSWTMEGYVPIYYPTEIISIGDYLYSVTYTNPAQIIKYDISTPGNPSKTVYDIVGQSSAINFSYNSSNENFYVECTNGNIIKISLSDLNNQTIISTGETDNFTIGESLDTYLKTFASTDNSLGEIIMLDESTIDSINTDARWMKQYVYSLPLQANTIFGSSMNFDLRYTKMVTSCVSMDIRWLEYEYDDISNYPINYDDIQVIIDGIDISNTGIDMKSISITHTKGTDSNASFTLYRKHDNLNNGCTITNNNSVVININGIQEFSGNIVRYDVDSELETVNVSAVMDEPSNNTQTKNIPLSSVGASFHLYDCILDKISNDNTLSFYNGSEDTRVVLTNDSGLYYASNGNWTGDINSASIYTSFETANAKIGIDGGHFANLTSQDVWAINYKEPKYYKGIAVNLGKSIQNFTNITESQNYSDLYLSVYNLKSLTEQLKNGTFIPEQNWEYFWSAEFEYFQLPSQEDRPDLYRYFNNPSVGMKYIGTSLGSLTTDVWNITNVKYIKQQQYGETSTDLGWYYVGDAPYRIISCKNGKKYSHHYYEDRDNGLYDVYSESYNYEEFAKRVAKLEYEKLKTINDEVLPRTSANINITLNGYYHYDVKLLSRINLVNTTESNIYKDNNGFPVSVKSINITTNNMQVSLQCDNELSKEEMEEIDSAYPDENSDKYRTPKRLFLNGEHKYDPNTWRYIP